MFNEQNTVENYIRDLLCPSYKTTAERVQAGQATFAETNETYHTGAEWQFIPATELDRQPRDVFVESLVQSALIRLNPAIAAHPDYADEVLYKLRAIVQTVRDEGLIRANEHFTAWLRNEMSMPFGDNYEHVTIRLIDHETPANNSFIITTQYTFQWEDSERRPDLVLLVNGLPLVIIEAKTPVRDAISWVDGASQLHDDYEKHVPELFVANVFNVATEGKDLHYGSVRMPIELWGPWRPDERATQGAINRAPEGLTAVGEAIKSLLHPSTLLDILHNFTLFATDKKKRRIKIVARYQQYEGANLMVQRVLAGKPRKGLLWHFQGSGKSLLMVFAAQKLRLHPALGNPTVLIIVDRIDLDAQISATFHGGDIPNLIKADSRAQLEQLLQNDTRKIIITTIYKFADADGVLNERENIIVMADEAHRTQEGNLGQKMRDALPNAFLFGLTGTPINKRDRNTFYAFGAEDDISGYMSRYGFEDSIRDGATLPLHFEPRLLDIHIDKAAIDEAYAQLSGGLTDLDREMLARKATKMAILVKSPERIDKICADIAQHFIEKVRPNGFKGMVVTYDRESCVLYKAALDCHLPPKASAVVMSVQSGRDEEPFQAHRLGRDEEEKLLDRFREANDPLQLLIVTAKLLTGFDAPILQAMYLDKPLRDHTLLQAICRTNRLYGDAKTHGLIVDYLGVFDDVAKALEFDEEGIHNVAKDIAALKDQLPVALQKCLTWFMGVDRTLVGYDGLVAAQECVRTNEDKDGFAADFGVLTKLWEATSPDPILRQYETDYRWLAQVYISLKPSNGIGGLVWHNLGAKTVELIHENIRVLDVSNDIDKIVVDAELLEAVLGTPNPSKKATEISIKLGRRLATQENAPHFRALSERLETLKERHELGQLHSVEFLKSLLELSAELVEMENDTPTPQPEDRGQAALTDLFESVRNGETPIIVERIVKDIDEIVRQVRFDEWQNSSEGCREVRKALRRTLLPYKLHKDDELFDKAYSYIEKYY